MSYSRYNTTTANRTKLRTPQDYSPFSGMCTVCTDDCPGPCEIGRSAMEGSEMLYPTAKATSQMASEKDYPVDFSHLNINGRCFGNDGTTPDKLAYAHADLSCEIGMGEEKIKLKAPYVFPAIAKLNWKSYYGGAALAGVVAVIGESLPTSDPEAVIENGQVLHLPRLKAMYDAFYEYYQGYGALFLQANPDDDRMGLLEYAIEKVGFDAVELKLAQAAKGIQGMGKVPTLEKAMELKKKGFEVYPDPEDPSVQQSWQAGTAEPFYKIDSLPDWNEEWLVKRVGVLREKGAKFVSVKTGPFRPADMARTLKMASRAGVDLVLVDTAGGGSGNSPIRMMNEWGYPPVYMEKILLQICGKMQQKGMPLPAIAIAGGFTLEDHVFKALALGSPFITLVGMGRSPMAAAMVGDTNAEAMDTGIPELKGRYGEKVEDIPRGAVGVYNYINRINTGLRQLMALCRKYTLSHIQPNDLVPLTRKAAEITGIPFAMEQDMEEIDNIFE